MNEIMTVEEMWQRYPKEWILIGDPQMDAKLALKGGTLLFHSKDREEMYDKAVELRPSRSATLYTGPLVEEGTELVL